MSSQCPVCLCIFEFYIGNLIHECGGPPPTEELIDLMQSDDVNHPAHYNKGGLECIDAIEAATGENFPGYLQGNAIKYLYRHAYKGNPVQDLDKAIWYINKLKGQYEDKRISKQSSEQRSSAGGGRSNVKGHHPRRGNRELPETD